MLPLVSVLMVYPFSQAFICLCFIYFPPLSFLTGMGFGPALLRHLS